MYQRTVLIVEDEPLIRMMLADALQDEGYAVIEAGTAPDGIALLQMHDIDAVITDIDMPGGVTGLELARFAASVKKGLPMIITSGGHLLKPEDLPGGASFLAKPYDLTKILEMLLRSDAARLRHDAGLGAVRAA